MKNKIQLLAILVLIAGLSSLSFKEKRSTEDKIQVYYATHLKRMADAVQSLKEAVRNNRSTKEIQDQFFKARITYKKLEVFTEYYFELDVQKINGPAIDFMEEEDPTAFQHPAGFQVIESYIYPSYKQSSQKKVLEYINQLLELTKGLSGNAVSFNPDNYTLDAILEELYRITALGITGFDSPVAQLSLPEAEASLETIQNLLLLLMEEITSSGKQKIEHLLITIRDARRFLIKNNDFNKFNRFEFISLFMNPACKAAGNLKITSNYPENPLRSGSIQKRGSLFSLENIKASVFLGDDQLTRQKIELGRKLFFDPLLSSNGNRSCASCHQPNKAFTDGLPKARMLNEHGSLLRNTPTLWNAGLQKTFFHDSRTSSLDDLIREVLSNEKEMNTSASTVMQQLSKDPGYRNLLSKAWPNSDTAKVADAMVNAISMYLHTLVSFNSRFDQHIRGSKKNLTTSEVNGFNLFMGKARCGTCHFAPFFNGSKPTLYYYQESEVLGVPATSDKNNPVLDTDSGRFNSTKKVFHRFAFKTPTLRNIALTAPYMHNGVFKTLEEVVHFYNKGGGKGLGIALPNQSLPFDKLHLSVREIKDIISFMKSLTDTSGKSFQQMRTLVN